MSGSVTSYLRLNNFDEEIDWDISVVDEYHPYSLSLRFPSVVNVFLVTRNNPTIRSFPLDAVFDPTGSKKFTFLNG